MIPTFELRWFHPGFPPDSVKYWFFEQCPGKRLGDTEEREDLYLAPSCDYLNIKLRQGRLEVKWRKVDLGKIQFGNAAEGKIEQWGKWLCEDDNVERFFLPGDVREDAAWIAVKKRRSQREIEFCHVELTELLVNGNKWWSIAFEALSESTKPLAFKNLVKSVINTYPTAPLPVEASYAYPHWLSLSV